MVCRKRNAVCEQCGGLLFDPAHNKRKYSSEIDGIKGFGIVFMGLVVDDVLSIWSFVNVPTYLIKAFHLSKSGLYLALFSLFIIISVRKEPTKLKTAASESKSSFNYLDLLISTAQIYA